LRRAPPQGGKGGKCIPIFRLGLARHCRGQVRGRAGSSRVPGIRACRILSWPAPSRDRRRRTGADVLETRTRARIQPGRRDGWPGVPGVGPQSTVAHHRATRGAAFPGRAERQPASAECAWILFTRLWAVDTSGSRIVLVDDVRTTGATLMACSDSLRPVRPARIDVVTFAAELSPEVEERLGLEVPKTPWWRD
jgi:hypothetical protein